MVVLLFPLRTLRNMKVRDSDALGERSTPVAICTIYYIHYLRHRDLAHRKVVEPTVLRWSPRHCLKTPAYKNKPKIRFGSVMVLLLFYSRLNRSKCLEPLPCNKQLACIYLGTVVFSRF